MVLIQSENLEMSASMSPPPLSAVSDLTTMDSSGSPTVSPELKTVSPHPGTDSPQSQPSSPLTRQLSISGLEVVFHSPFPISPTQTTDDELSTNSSDSKPAQTEKLAPTAPNSDPSSAPEALPLNHDDKIPVANQDPQDPASAPEVISANPLFSIIGPEKGGGQSTQRDTAQRQNVNDELDENGEPNPLIQPDLPAYSEGVAGVPAQNPPRTESGLVRERREEENEWNNSLWGCCSRFDLLCEALFCPCILAGRTHTRISKPEQDYFTASNLYCVNCCVLIFPIVIGLPLWCLPMSASRRELRFRYGLKGSHYGDICASMWCPCCVLVQEEREIAGRTKGAMNMENSTRDEGYRRQTQEMRYVDQTQSNV